MPSTKSYIDPRLHSLKQVFEVSRPFIRERNIWFTKLDFYQSFTGMGKKNGPNKTIIKL